MNEPEFTRSEKEIQAEILAEPEVDDQRNRKPGLKRVLLTALLMVGVIVVGLGFGYRYWQELQSTLDRMDKAVSEAEQRQIGYRQQLDSLRQAMEMQQQQLAAAKARQAAQEGQRDQGQQRLEQERLRLQQQWAEMREALQAPPQQIQPDSSGWVLAEVEYLIQAANYRLLLARDVGTAIQALEIAERRLRQAVGPQWIGVRERLTADISRLQAVALPDPAALSARLTGLEQEITSLKLVATESAAEAPGPAVQTTTPLQERSFKTMLRDGWDGLRSVLVIRRHDQPPSIGLPPEQQYFVYQNLRLQLAAARLALLRGDQGQYQASLQRVEQWLREFFDSESAATQAVLGKLDDLSQINLSPVLPDISGSLLDLRQRLQSVGEEGAAE